MKNLLVALIIFIQFIGIECSSETADGLWKIVAFTLCSGILVMLAAVVCLLWKLVKLRDSLVENAIPPSPNNNRNVISSQQLQKVPSNNQEDDVEWGMTKLMEIECEDLNLERKFEINTENLMCMKMIEKGLFNVIQKGELKMPRGQRDRNWKLDVMVKGACDQDNDIQQMMIVDEINALKAIGKHPNLLAIVGYVVNPHEKLIVSEYAECGKLLDLLKTYRNNFDASNSDNRTIFSDLLSFAYQIANGMIHLAGIPLIHRQLALRSVLITKDKTIRISDFSLARSHGNNEYYKIMRSKIPLPFHWMAPETFEDYRFTEKSDVWSFGVCLWEIFTMGKIPYEDVVDVLAFLNRGRRLKKPELCNDEIYEFMKTCWAMDPDLRPTFTKCVQFFEEYLEDYDNQLLEEIKNRLDLAAIAQERLEQWTNGEEEDSDD